MAGRAGALAALALAIITTTPARAEVQIQAYGGLNENFSSDVTVRKGAVDHSRSVDWDGKSFALPPYWGVRGIYWFDAHPNWGVAVDYMHAKAYGKINFATDPVYSKLEFTDGNNILTANLMYRFGDAGQRFRPYMGAGLGLAIPHVEVGLKAFPAQETLEYQVTGLAALALVGLEYQLTPRWSAFIEGKLSYTRIDADLDGGGSLTTDIWSPHLALGLSYRF